MYIFNIKKFFVNNSKIKIVGYKRKSCSKYMYIHIIIKIDKKEVN